MKVRCVSFDLGGTLISPWPSVGAVYVDVAKRFHVETLTADEVNARFLKAWRDRGSFSHTKEAWRDLVSRTLAGIVPDDWMAGLFEALFERFTHADVWRIFPDVAPTLAALKEKGLKLALISNWDERARLTLNNLDLAKNFDVVSISVEVGVTKPAPKIFRVTAERLGVAPETILHVGDSWEEDVLGAQSAGFQAALIDRTGTATDPVGRGAACFRDLREVIEQVRPAESGFGSMKGLIECNAPDFSAPLEDFREYMETAAEQQSRTKRKKTK